MIDAKWFLATCLNCDPNAPLPFRDEVERDTWSTAHMGATGHRVVLTENKEATQPRLHFDMKNGIEWDIDANLPMYTRDFLKMINEGKLDDICTYGTVTH